ncbi:MAG: hypothetical protein AAFQ98_11250 [Bacteroidota bacterium]
MEVLPFAVHRSLPVGGALSYTSFQRLQVDPDRYSTELQSWLEAFPRAAWAYPGLQDIRVLGSQDRSCLHILMAWESQSQFTAFMEGDFWQFWEPYLTQLRASGVVLQYQHHHQLFELIE